MSAEQLVLVINPGSTSTKIAVFSGDNCQHEVELVHPAEELAGFASCFAQLDFRSAAVETALRNWNIPLSALAAAIGRGGPLKPLSGGVYRVGAKLLEDIASGQVVDHASLLGGVIAGKLMEQTGRPAFFADPVSVDEFDDLARISGLPELPRISLGHTLNIKAVGDEVAKSQGKRLNEVNYIIAHLGGGISVAAHRRGRMVDVNNANDAGPFSPERVGSVPLTGLLKLCYSGKYSAVEMKKKLIGKGGLVAHLGTSDAREVSRRIEAGDAQARLVLEAMAYAIAKEIGAMATVLQGKVDAIILTGGLAHNHFVVDWVRERVNFIAPVIVKPGQNELQALARHAFAALSDPGIVKEYQ